MPHNPTYAGGTRRGHNDHSIRDLPAQGQRVAADEVLKQSQEARRAQEAADREWWASR